MLYEGVSDDALLVSSFADSGELFFFLGFEATRAADERVRQIRAGQVPLVRELPGFSAAVVGFEVGPPPAPPPPSPSRSPVLSAPAPASEAPPVVLLPPHIPPIPFCSQTILCYDTETIGLKPAVICQLAFAVVSDGRLERLYDRILRLPANVRVGARAQEIHGISTAMCASQGVDAKEALGDFCALAQRVLLHGGRVVAHNATFDVRAVRETRDAWNVIPMGENQPLEAASCFCTMKESRVHSELKTATGRRKAFSNAELYAHLHGGALPSFARLHSAADDVFVTLSSYCAGVRAGWW